MSAQTRINLESILPTKFEVALVITLGLLVAVFSVSWWIGLIVICLGTSLLVLARYQQTKYIRPCDSIGIQIVTHDDIMKLRLDTYRQISESTPLDHHECEILAHKIVKEQLEELQRRNKIQVQRIYSNRQS